MFFSHGKIPKWKVSPNEKQTFKKYFFGKKEKKKLFTLYAKTKYSNINQYNDKNNSNIKSRTDNPT